MILITIIKITYFKNVIVIARFTVVTIIVIIIALIKFINFKFIVAFLVIFIFNKFDIIIISLLPPGNYIYHLLRDYFNYFT